MLRLRSYQAFWKELAVFVAMSGAAWGQAGDVGHQAALNLKAGKFAEARELLEPALKKSPGDARLWTFEGLTLVQLGDAAGALQAFERALKIAPDYLPALEGAAQIEYQSNSAKAEGLVRRILQLRPDDVAAQDMLSAITVREGDCDALKAKVAPSALRAYGTCLVHKGRLREALPVFEHLTVVQPEDDRARYALAVVEFLSGKFDAASATLGVLLEKDETNADAVALRAATSEQMGDRVKAMAEMRLALELQPDDVEFYTEYAYMCQRSGAFQRGVEAVDAGLRLEPNAAPLYVARGILYSELGKFDQGQADFAKADQLDPNVELGTAAEGLAELQENDLAKAEATARVRLKSHADDAFSNYLLAAALIKRGAKPQTPEYAEALQAAKRAVAAKPDFNLARDLLAQIYFKAGMTEEAIQQSRIAYRENPEDPTAIYHLILALKKSGQTDELPGLMKQLMLAKGKSRASDSSPKLPQ